MGWRDTITKANGFLHQLESSSFLICFNILSEVLPYLRSLTLKLQMQALDLMESSSFLICFKTLSEVLSYLSSLILMLQMQALDLMHA